VAELPKPTVAMVNGAAAALSQMRAGDE